MKNRSLLWGSALLLAGLSLASAKSYDIRITDTVKVGAVELKPGEYSLKVDGSNATFKNADTGQSATAAFKIENSAKKHDQTAIQTTGDKVTAIELGGSTETLEFGE